MPHSQDKNNDKRKQPNPILKYSGMAGQMIAIILIGAFGGMKLDSHFQTEHAYFTGGLTILGVILAMYFVIRDLLKG